MALSLQDSLFVWQKVKASSDSLNLDKVIVDSLKSLKERLAGVGGNPNLQFVPIDATTVDDASGAILADVACRLYAVVAKKQATATDVFLHILDDATDDTGIATDTRVMLSFIESSDQAIASYPKGVAMGTGVVAKAYTESDGVTDSASTDTPNGFIIIGAA